MANPPSKLVLIILSILLPPVAVFLIKGFGGHFILNIVLWVLLFGLGGIIHALILTLGD